MSKKLIKSKSNFTLKRLHQSGNYGNIYERDILTISNGGFAPEGQIPIYQSPSFKLSIRAGYNGTKIYNYGDWLINDAICSSSDNKTSWTISCMPAPNMNDSKIKLKLNPHKLSNFVCYSSASELIRTSLNDIIYRFPGELYVNDEKLTLESFDYNKSLQGSDLYFKLQIGDYYVVENPMNIDITQLSMPEDTPYSPIKFFCNSFKKYQLIDSDNHVFNIKNWVVTENKSFTNCLINGLMLGTVKLEFEKTKPMVIDVYYYNNDLLLLSTNSGCHIRPNEDIIDDFFNSLDDFQKIILNRDTNYTAKFETYVEDDEYGWYTTEEEYQWPVDMGDWNLCINGVEYANYINSLEELAFGYDENYTDAIWRTMTHEAISNMDLTLKRNNEDIETPNSSKVKKVLNIIGRQFDDIKKYIDNIKCSNTVSYTQEDNNAPDYFLTDKLGLAGWETNVILNDISEGEDTISFPQYSTMYNYNYTASDANNSILQRLILNSKNILAKKGTIKGIEDLLGVFGFHSIEWLKNYYNGISNNSELYGKAFDIEEYVYTITPYSNITNIEKVKNTNALKNENYNELESGNDNPYFGLPLAEAVIYPSNTTYLIPWFDKELKYDGDLYFQMKGGWMKDLTLSSNSSNDIYSNWYDYTSSNIYIYNTKDEIPDFLKKEGNYFYIQSENLCYRYKNDNNEFEIYPKINTKISNSFPNEQQTNSNNEAYRYIIFNEEYYRWKNIPDDMPGNITPVTTQSDLNKYQGTKYATLDNVCYKWDEGQKKYVEYGEYVKCGITPKNAYTRDGNLEDLKRQFINDNKGNNPHSGYYDDGNTYRMAYNKFFNNSTFNDVEVAENVKDEGFEIVLDKSLNKKCVIVKDEINGEGINKNLVQSTLESLYTINSKRIKIKFDLKYQKFIRENILPYLKQIIPSTTIIEYDFVKLQGESAGFISMGVADDTNTFIFEINKLFKEETSNTLIIEVGVIPTNKTTDYLLLGNNFFKWEEHYVYIDKTPEDLEYEYKLINKPSDATDKNTLLITDDTLPSKEQKGYDYIVFNNNFYSWEVNVFETTSVIPSNEFIKPSDATDENTYLPKISLPKENMDGYEYVRYDDTYYVWDNKDGIYKKYTGKTAHIDYIICKERVYKWYERYEILDELKPSDATDENTLILNESVNVLPTVKQSDFDYIKFENIYYKWDDNTNEYVKYIISDKTTILDVVPTNKVENDDIKYLFIDGVFYEWVDNKYQPMVDKPNDAIL